MAVVVWERRSAVVGGPSDSRRRTVFVLGQSHYWQPYSAEVTHLIERSFQRNLTSAQLSDVASIGSTDQKVIHFGSLLEQRTVDGSTHCGEGIPIRRSICSADSCAGLGISWQWFSDQTNRWHLYNVSVQDHIEKAYQNAEGGIDLSKTVTYPLPYTIDFANMMQKRKSTATRRPVRRCVDQPYPLARANVSSPQESASIRRSERIAARTTSLPKTQDSPAALSSSTLPQGCTGADRLQPRPCTDQAQGSLSSMFFGWLRTPLFRSASTPEFKSSAKGCDSADEPSLAKKSVMTSFMRRHNKRPTAKNPCIVDSSVHAQQDEVSEDELLRKYGEVQSTPPDDNCTICYDSLRSPSSYEDGDSVILELTRCGHVFHSACIRAMLKSQSPVTYLQCPTCKVIHGIKFGNQPPGKMTYFITRKSLPGYDGVHTICITYNFWDGIQDESHPSPRRPYSGRTFPRFCYLPDDAKGRKVLRLLIVAWQRRLTFTIGSSMTTGQQDVVTWNEIHHKTEFGSNFTGHGYPDPNYLDNVLLELAAHGVFDDDGDSVSDTGTS